MIGYDDVNLITLKQELEAAGFDTTGLALVNGVLVVQTPGLDDEPLTTDADPIVQAHIRRLAQPSYADREREEALADLQVRAAADPALATIIKLLGVTP